MQKIKESNIVHHHYVSLSCIFSLVNQICCSGIRSHNFRYRTVCTIFSVSFTKVALFLMILTRLYRFNLAATFPVVDYGKGKIEKIVKPASFYGTKSIPSFGINLGVGAGRRKSTSCMTFQKYQKSSEKILSFAHKEGSSRNISSASFARRFSHSNIFNSVYTSRSVRLISTSKVNQKLNIVLDLDECLVHSQITEPEGLSYRQQEFRPETLKNADKLETFQLLLSDNALVKVHKRPFLDEFLRNISSRYENVYVFTAGTEDYAKPVFDTLDPEGKIFKGRFYRQHCTRAGVLYVKDLSTIHKEIDMTKTVLIDNNEISFIANPENGILVRSFYDDHQDKTLPAVYEFLCKELENEKDVRVKLKEMFQLRQHLMAYKHHVPLNYRQKWFLRDQEIEEEKND